MSNRKPSTNTANRVDDNVWISGCIPAFNEEFLKKFNIKRIIKLFRDKDDEKHIFPGISYFLIDAKDTPNYNLAAHFQEIADFIQTGLDHDEQILIHCHAGVSRSATVVIMYLTLCGMSIPQAYKFLKYQRDVINPNPGFVNQLIQWKYALYGQEYCKYILNQVNALRNQKYYKLPAIKQFPKLKS